MFDVTITGLEELNKHIEFVKKLAKMKTDTSFQKFMQDKCLQTVNRIARESLGGTTNDEYISEYILRNKIEEKSDGFILYNDLVIPAVIASARSGYEEGFPLALAFEYGVGIVGQNNPVNGAWQYNVHNYQNGWYYKDMSTGEAIHTYGYQGAEVYRKTAMEVQNQLSNWVNEYYSKEV